MRKQIPTLDDIADALSPSQCAAILWLPKDGSWRPTEARSSPNRNSFYALKEWRRGDPTKTVTTIAKLVEQQPPQPAARGSGRIWAEDVYRLTPLGVKLRPHVEQRVDHR